MGSRVILCGATALASFASLMIWSCGAFSGVDEPNSDGATTAIDAQRSDGGATIDASDAHDAGNLGDASDSGKSLDGAGFGQVDATPFCPTYETTAIYCADFDEVDASGYGFYGDGGFIGYFANPVGSGAAYAVDKLSFVSPQHEVTFTTTTGAATDANGRASAVFRGNYGISSMANLSFSVYIVTIDSSSPMTLADINFSDGVYDVALVVGGIGNAQLVELKDGTTNATHDLGAPFSTGAWVDVTVHINFGTGKIDATIGTIDHPFTGTDMSGGQAVFSYGIVYYDANSVAASMAHFDNVVFTGN